jgi:hypothetical protein
MSFSDIKTTKSNKESTRLDAFVRSSVQAQGDRVTATWRDGLTRLPHAPERQPGLYDLDVC